MAAQANASRTFSAENAENEGFKLPKKLESFRPAEWKENEDALGK
eukprot:CAMPEP_0205925138 /NCGR_PEP_ID=MMETSP1325-20131115/17475_1 /ASSEMBLY_ACC=CAM_ASM_000708 /TAXON_ID=236786 /ORGANISM="Florenciella sp., Strain RCC1007" /LENGTH=44 /DNA_ID= /DNA_START= /DNA_END= /DNA_ORIENTATION=